MSHDAVAKLPVAADVEVVGVQYLLLLHEENTQSLQFHAVFRVQVGVLLVLGIILRPCPVRILIMLIPLSFFSGSLSSCFSVDSRRSRALERIFMTSAVSSIVLSGWNRSASDL